jgi:TPP-dependent pyruvate/acetoin dehydrogenase alpha subunit
VTLDKKKLLEIFTALVKVRRLEERLVELFTAGAFPGWMHPDLGQEAVGIGVTLNLRQDDYITSTHRSRAVFVGKGIDLKSFMAETFAKKDGTCQGRVGEMRFMDIDHGILGYSVIVGAWIPFAVGVAFSCKYRGTDQVSVAFFGDGAVDSGPFHESLNIAAVWKLPVLFLCENNGWAQFTPQQLTASMPQISKKAVAYGIPGKTVDGDDAIAVYEAARDAIAYVREGNGPMLLECKTHRWLGHFIGDNQKYRDPDEIKECRKFDPLLRFQNRLLDEGVLTQEIIEDTERKIKAEIDEAVDFAQKSETPDPEEAMKDVYCRQGEGK